MGDDSLTLPFVRDRPAEAAASAADDPRWRALRTCLLFDGLGTDELRAALADGTIEVLEVPQGALVPLGGVAGVVRGGRVALARFAREVLADERRAAAFASASPTRRAHIGGRASAILALLDEGEVAETTVGGTTACFAVTPAIVITVSRRRVELWAQARPFVGDRLRRALTATAAKLSASDEDRGWIGERARRAAADGFERSVAFQRAPRARSSWWSLLVARLRHLSAD